ncbi:MDR family MFS transporter [Lacticaseibacillus brantae]|uniref:Drug resistance MFS transporter, drug H+ antiporter-1 family protein n=1 Tax=Lacticaseibacillus brantae DSM 23927 TaxID=1423727 RepID=A0A0R2B2A9_9LACO|nr:MDR family MFS transporter [Lacticaseibacillus brantae]KRM72100.1 drug resistance MFS transporter, drug H+ antiporter-1 family protein [Lacticaseibacillus brantae DSM 23927]
MEKTNVRYNRTILVVVVILSAFVTMLNQTILSVAQPSIIDAFKVDLSTVQWLSTGYSLIGGILIPISAWMADRFNTKWLVSSALGVFLVGSVVAAFSGDFTVLLVGRLLQAVGGGVLNGLTMTILFSVYPKENRGTPTTLLGLVFGIAPAVGPTLGGFLVDNLGWHSIFGIVAPVVGLAFVLGLFFMADVVPHKTTKLDFWSVVFSTVGFGGVLYGASMVSDYGWTDVHTLLPGLVGIVVVGLFIWRQLVVSDPMLNLKVFTSGNFTVAAIISAITQISMVAVEFVLPVYLQNARDLTAFQSGLTLLPGAIVMFLLAPLSGQLVQKNKGKQIVVFGITVMALSTLLLSRLTLTTPIWELVAIYALRNMGLAFAMMPAGTLGMQGLTPDLISHGSAANNVVRQVGAAIGTAVLVSVMQSKATAASPSASLLKTDPAAYGHGMHLALVSGAQASLIIATIIGVVGIGFALALKQPKKKA